jgi:hypothetical protein
MKIKHTQPAIPGKTLGLVILLAFACSSPGYKSGFIPPPELSPIMVSLRINSRDFKRALVVKDRARYAPAAARLNTAIQPLATVQGPDGFEEKTRVLMGRGHRLLEEARSEAREARLENLFNDLVAGCITCHEAFRPGRP